MLTANAKQAGIIPNRVEQIAVDPAKPDQMWIIGSVPGFRAKADVSQTPPLEETSRGLAAQAATQDRIQAEPRVAMRR